MYESKRRSRTDLGIEALLQGNVDIVDDMMAAAAAPLPWPSSLLRWGTSSSEWILVPVLAVAELVVLLALLLRLLLLLRWSTLPVALSKL